MKQEELAKRLDNIADSLTSKNVEESYLLLKDLSSELKQCIEIQYSSCKLLNCFVNDILCLAQIKEGKFRKECSNFDIRDAVREIMSIQQ